jgi:hypothetical protein
MKELGSEPEEREQRRGESRWAFELNETCGARAIAAPSLRPTWPFHGRHLNFSSPLYYYGALYLDFI